MEVWNKALKAIYIKSGCTVQTLKTFDVGKLRLREQAGKA